MPKVQFIKKTRRPKSREIRHAASPRHEIQMDAARAQQAWPGLATMGASKKHKLYSGLDNGLKTGDISLSIAVHGMCTQK